jgi:hypothetical protein
MRFQIEVLRKMDYAVHRIIHLMRSLLLCGVADLGDQRQIHYFNEVDAPCEFSYPA